MVLSNTGIIEHNNPVYQQTIDLCLPAALFLMLVTVDVRAILHLGPKALIVFLAGMLGVMVGMIVGFWVVKPMIGPEFATGFGVLTGSWTGGSANMIAAKEALNVPDKVFTLMLILDSTVPYLWMGFLIFLCSKQHHIDRHHGAEQFKQMDVERLQTSIQWPIAIVMLIFALGLSLLLSVVDNYLPVVKGIVSSFTWTIILVTTIALCLGVTSFGRWAHKGVGPWGQWMLFFVLVCIGTKGDLSQFRTAPWLFLGGFIALFIHAGITYSVGRLIKAPLFLMAVASQANLGGVASASMLAEIYRPGLASVGLLMAILGNIIGTYVAILTGHICRLVAGAG